MTTTPLSIRAVLLEQTARTRHCSKSDIARFLEESESKVRILVELLDRERACVAALKHVISPIHTLPVELLAEIFKLAIDGHTHIKDAFQISQVCSDWRQVAHSTPRLWTRRLRVDLRSDYSEVYAEGLRAWLARSAPLPIHISLMPWSEDISPRMSEDVLTIVPRCRCLELQEGPSHCPSLPQLVSQLSQSRLDMLEELDLSRIYSIMRIDFVTVPRPRLRNLKIFIRDRNLSQILMPWAQLTDLSLFAAFPNILLDILRQCANLIRASVTTTGWDELPQEQSILTLTHLRTLSVTFLGMEKHVTPFFDYISAPVLLELSVSMNNHTHRWTEAHFTAFQLRAQHLTRLQMDVPRLTSGDLRAALLHAPSLTHLEITSWILCFDDALVGALYYYKDGVTPLVPHLHSLVLHGEDGGTLKEDSLAGMIASRWWTDTELTSHDITPNVARWTRVELQWYLSADFYNALKDIPSDVLIR